MSTPLPHLDPEYVKQLVEMMKSTGLDELEISNNGVSIRLRRPGSAPMAMPTAAYTAPIATVATPAPIAENAVTSPMVGTFYRSASPSTPPLVQVGSVVKKGQQLCIIEAMKTMNPVESDRDGTIAAVLVENAQPVEFGQPLFEIK